MPLYRAKRKLIYFVHIPKTGGSSVEKALAKAGCKQAMLLSKARNKDATGSKMTPQHMHAAAYTAYFPAGFFDYMFAVVRNPFGRIASEYKMKVVAGKEEGTPDVWISEVFDRFAVLPHTRDNHIRPQIDFISEGVEVFNLENGLDLPVQAAFNALGLKREPKIPHSRPGGADKLSVTQKTIDKITAVYAQDFEEFGYDPTEFSKYFDVK